MKKLVFVAAALAALLVSCAKEEKQPATERQVDTGLTLKATIDQSTKATINYNKILWADGDQINVHNGSGFTLFNLSAGAGTGDAEFTQASGDAVTPKGVAVFPASIAKSYAGGTTTVTLPSSYSNLAAGEIPVPMVASVEYDSVEELNFKPLTGFIRFGYTSAKVAGAKYFVVETDRKVNGDFEVAGYTVSASSDYGTGENVIKVEIPDNVFSFIVPLPAGEYGYIKMYLTDEGDNKLNTVEEVEYTNETVARLDLITASYGCKYNADYVLSATLTGTTAAGKLTYNLFTDPNETGHKYARVYQLLSAFESHQGSISDYLATSRTVYSTSKGISNNLDPDSDYVFIMLRVKDDATLTSGKSSDYTGEYSIYQFHTPSLDEIAQMNGYSRWIGTWNLKNSGTFKDDPLVLTITEDVKGCSYNLKGLAKNTNTTIYEKSVMTLHINLDGTVTLKTQTHPDNTFTNNDVVYYPGLARYVATSTGAYTTVDYNIVSMAFDNETATSASISSVPTISNKPVASFRVVYTNTSTSKLAVFALAPKIDLDGMTWEKDSSATTTSGYAVDPVEF